MSNVKRRRTHEQFLEEVEEVHGKEYEVITKFKTMRDKVTVRHTTCGRVYEVRPDSLLYGSRCMACVRKGRRKTHDQYIVEVNEAVGEEYTFLEKYNGADTKIKVRHNSCGHKYMVTPYKFLDGRRCPECAIRIRREKQITPQKEIEKRVETLTDGEYKVSGAYKGVNRRTQVTHNVCGYAYVAVMKDFYRGEYRCWKCNYSSEGEKVVNSFLKDKKINYIPEFSFKDLYKRDIRYPLRFDFAVIDDDNKPLILIEYDGIHHFYETEWNNLRDVQESDKLKNEYCDKNGLTLYRIPYTDYDRIAEVLTGILEEENIN